MSFLRRSALVLSMALALVACGRSDGEKTLDAMHARYVTQVMDVARYVKQPDVGFMDSEISMRIQPDPYPLVSLFPGATEVLFSTATKFDLRSTRSPVIDSRVHFAMESDIPQQEEASIFAHADIELVARVTGRTLLLQIPKMSLSYPMLGDPGDVTTKWYGITFDDANKKLKELSEGNEPLPSVEKVLHNAFAGTPSPAAVKQVAENIHLWNAVEVLPEKDGLLQVRVASDKKKIRASAEAFLKFINEFGQSSWKRHGADRDFGKLVEDLAGPDAALLKSLAAAEGVLSIEKGTYAFRGFEGDLIDAAGKRLGHVNARTGGSGGTMFSATVTESGREVAFRQKDGVISLSMNGHDVVNGTWKNDMLSLRFMDSDPAKSALTLDVAEIDVSPEHFSASEMRMTLDNDLSLAIIARDIDLVVHPERGAFQVSASWAIESDGRKIVEGTSRASRLPLPSITVDKPPFRPFTELKDDLYQTLYENGMVGGDPSEDAEMEDDLSY